MGKLVEKLEKIGQAGGSSLGFMRARTSAQKPRPAAVVVALTSSDGAVAEAAAKNGADIVIVQGWQSGTDLSAITAALDGSETVWGVEVAAEGKDAQGALSAARDAGASFAVIGQATPVQTLLEEVERFDTVLAVEPPQDELALVLLRAQNLLPVRVALLQTQMGNADLARLSVGDFARLNLAFESVRFPTLIALSEAPEAAHVKTLVRMGADGVILPGKSAKAAEIGAQVAALREELEKTPARPDEHAPIAIGGMVEQGGQSLAQPSRKEPEKDPEKE